MELVYFPVVFLALSAAVRHSATTAAVYTDENQPHEIAICIVCAGESLVHVAAVLERLAQIKADWGCTFYIRTDELILAMDPPLKELEQKGGQMVHEQLAGADLHCKSIERLQQEIDWERRQIGGMFPNGTCIFKWGGWLISRRSCLPSTVPQNPLLEALAAPHPCAPY